MFNFERDFVGKSEKLMVEIDEEQKEVEGLVFAKNSLNHCKFKAA